MNIPLTWRHRDVIGNIQINENEIGRDVQKLFMERGRMEISLTINRCIINGKIIHEEIISADMNVIRE